MATKKQGAGIPLLDVAVALIRAGEQVLIVYNNEWRAFTLPMTKRRAWADPEVPATTERQEEWIEAAARAAAECLGRTLAPEEIAPAPIADGEPFTQSDRNGVIKQYHYQVFEIRIAKPERLADGVVAEWLTLKEIPTHRPISPTVKYLVALLKSARI